jgi:oxygen-independent coproporphyrinogen-3 oxidase
MSDVSGLPEERLRRAPTRDGAVRHLYVHVPFCRSRCAYCDFHALTLSDAPERDGRVERFTERCSSVVRDQAARRVVGELDTLYVGGGTPSAIGPALPRLLRVTLEAAGVGAGAEITIEANPESLDARAVEDLAEAGATRISLGVQSLDDAVLEVLGRRHDASAARCAVSAVLDSGLALSVDLMCGIPGQSDASWRATVESVLESGVEHVSVYPLGLEEGTPLEHSVRQGSVGAPDEDVAASMMERARRWLEDAGLAHYEISNYAVPGKESRHNTAYWTGEAYLGIGPSAASMLTAELAAKSGVESGCPAGTSRVRFAVDDAPGSFDEGVLGRLRDAECLDARQADLEDVVLGLRLAAGVPRERAEAVGAIGTLEEARERGLVSASGGVYRLHDRGWLLANEVFAAVWDLH